MNFVCQNELFSELSSQHTLLATSIIVTFIFLRYTHKAIKRCVSNVDTCAKLPLTSKSTNKRTRSTLNSRATSAPGESFILYLVLFNHLSFSTSHWIWRNIEPSLRFSFLCQHFWSASSFSIAFTMSPEVGLQHVWCQALTSTRLWTTLQVSTTDILPQFCVCCMVWFKPFLLRKDVPFTTNYRILFLALQAWSRIASYWNSNVFVSSLQHGGAIFIPLQVEASYHRTAFCREVSSPTDALSKIQWMED